MCHLALKCLTVSVLFRPSEADIAGSKSLLRFRKGTHKRNTGLALYWDAVLAVKWEVNDGYCYNSSLDCSVANVGG